ncbi:coiled-coil domain-containing protein 93 isoform X2 [Solanum pennellii]|uniref:Coiled-coil domain-containing protein 93 isoform X2 n=1 Tax=Solanum pennellii TaxID=28526 RepID=A0ABM1GWX9_SOLPN|nr:coiled-coil domain-containing protein 93 isoform X2 [Solanum pennellii]
MEELKKDDLLSEIKQIEEKIDGDSTAQKILWLLETSKVGAEVVSLSALDNQESELQSRCILEHAKLQTKVDEFEELLQKGKEVKFSENLDHTFRDSTEKLDFAKRELAAKLRSTLSFKRQLDDVPSQAELIQYELRLSELYTHIQGKDRQTRKYYATYNTLLGIKELMLKETSLLNSIRSQFKDALTSPASRKKLIDSMEGIMHGTQQKLEKVQIALQSELKAHEALKGQYAAAVSEQRHYNSILEAFQVECARNEILRMQTSKERLAS